MTVLLRLCVPTLAASVALAACGVGESREANIAPAEQPVAQAPRLAPAAPDGVGTRLAKIEAAIADWRSASTLAAAHRAAEAARNLVVGPAGPYYGDADGDGRIAGQGEAGLLPGLRGEPGLAQPPGNACILRDVLGGDWSDPGERWAVLERAIGSWSETRNPFPTLPSHPQRIVGWASLTLDTRDLAKAREFAGHAKIHSDVSRRALETCR